MVEATDEQSCGITVPKSQISALSSRLDADLATWRERLLISHYPYQTVHVRYEHVRFGGRVVSQGVLIVSGVRDDWHRYQVHFARNLLGQVARCHRAD